MRAFLEVKSFLSLPAAVVDVEDLALAHILAFEKPGASGRYLLSSGGVSWIDFYNILRTVRRDSRMDFPPAFGCCNAFHQWREVDEDSFSFPLSGSRWKECRFLVCGKNLILPLFFAHEPPKLHHRLTLLSLSLQLSQIPILSRIPSSLIRSRRCDIGGFIFDFISPLGFFKNALRSLCGASHYGTEHTR